MLRTLPTSLLSILLLSVLVLVGCDNVGRAFDPVLDPTNPGAGTTTSPVQVVPVGGDAVDGRPKVKTAFPSGGGWPGTVPIVVEFSESLNEDSILPTSATATDAKVLVRVKGTTQAVPATYNFVAAGRVLVVRPVTALSNEQNPSYEIVLLPEGRDADGVRFDVVSGGEVLKEFQVNQAAEITDGRILTTFPRDNQVDRRETACYVFFDRPANPTSITATNLLLRPQGGSAVASAIDAPLELLGNDDPRIWRITPSATLSASTRYEFVVDDTITFGAEGTLDFRGRTPFAGFDTVAPRAPTAVHVGNPTAGFDDKINRSNLSSVVLHVTTPSDAEAGDTVLARIYGGDRLTTPIGDKAFFERTAVATTAGAQTVVLDFAGALGTVDRPNLDDGEVTFAVQMRRGSEHSGFAQNAASASPVCDVTAPTLSRAGPPGSVAGNNIYCDQETLVFYGTASERLGAASLVVGSLPAVELFASAADGRFVMKKAVLGRFTSALGYSLNLTDRAGNLAVASTTGNVESRGVITGTFTGTLVVEAYDHATLAPIPDATVLIDIDTPVVPAVGQVTGTTDSVGRATFNGLGGSLRTVTIVRAGYHLVTLYDSAAAHVSLPLRPLTNATATFAGSALFQPSVGTTALVGNNTYDDPVVMAVPTTTTASSTIPDTAIQPNRPQVITAFAGTIEPTASPGYTLHGYQMLGQTLTTLTPPAAPATPGATSSQNVTLLPASGLVGTLQPSVAKDFALAVGLDTANLVGGKPIVRAMASLEGFGGQVLAGVGPATVASGAAYTWSATYGLPLTTGLAPYVPTIWGAIEARDIGGRVSRTRGLFLSGTFFDTTPAPAIPAIGAPSGAFTGSPAVTYDDTLSPATVTASLLIVDVVARDPNGRQWFLHRLDRDTDGGTETVQFPDLATANVAGLVAGNWSVRTEARAFLQLINGASSDDFVLAERQRMEVTFARGAAVVFTVQ